MLYCDHLNHQVLLRKPSFWSVSVKVAVLEPQPLTTVQSYSVFLSSGWPSSLLATLGFISLLPPSDWPR